MVKEEYEALCREHDALVSLVRVRVRVRLTLTLALTLTLTLAPTLTTTLTPTPTRNPTPNPNPNPNQVQMGASYGSYDALGKLAFLDALEAVEARWDIFFARFSLVGALNADFKVRAS